MMTWQQFGGLANGQVGGLDDAGLYDPGFVSDLNKALTAGADIDNPGSAPGEGFPLRMESLESTLYNVTYDASHIQFWKSLQKDKAYNTVEEYNRLEAYGQGAGNIFMGEGDLPNEDDSEYSRQYTKIKFMGVVRRVSHVMTTLRAAHGDVIARETINGTLDLLKSLEVKLFSGREDLLDLEFDGLEYLLTNAWGSTATDDGYWSGYEDDNVIDLRGQPLTEDIITDLCDILVNSPNYGQPNKLWSPTGPLKDLSKIMYPKERAQMGEKGIAGVYVEKIRTPFGDVDMVPDIFIPDSSTPNDSALGKAGSRPSSPTVSSITSPAYGGSNTNYWSSTDAGSYYYKIVARNRYGASAAVTTSQVTVSAADQVSIVVQSGSDVAFFEVYRSDKDGAASTCRKIMEVKRTAATQTLVDLNRFLPNTSKAYLLTQTPQVLKWKQLAPFTKMPLAQIDTSIRWMQILYGALQIMAPRKCGMIINIGRLETGAYA